MKILNDGKVKYLVVGGYAVSKHAEPRFTKDLDIWISNSPENAERVFQSLTEFGSPMTGITPQDFTDSALVYQIGVEPARIDILMGLDGLDFDECWNDRVIAAFGDTETNFISIDDLIENKRTVARPQDLLDAESLEIKKREQENIDTDIG
ncbi:MAG: hypothetical protein ABI791_13985 [Acidobacteriota bacterium]